MKPCSLVYICTDVSKESLSAYVLRNVGTCLPDNKKTGPTRDLLQRQFSLFWKSVYDKKNPSTATTTEGKQLVLMRRNFAISEGHFVAVKKYRRYNRTDLVHTKKAYGEVEVYMFFYMCFSVHFIR
jgi:hypothetical protein